MRDVIEKAIKILAGKASGASDPNDAYLLSQSATNLAEALAAFEKTVQAHS